MIDDLGAPQRFLEKKFPIWRCLTGWILRNEVFKEGHDRKTFSLRATSLTPTMTVSCAENQGDY